MAAQAFRPNGRSTSPDDSRLVIEKAFGPTLPLLRLTGVDKVIGRTNNTSYGLAALIWLADADRALAIASRLEVGTVWTNQTLAVSPMTPVGGAKQSGIGVEGGSAVLIEFTQVKSIFIPKTWAN